MVRRLVLGCGSVGHPIVIGLSGRRDDLSVIDPDADRVETLRNEGIMAERGDPSTAAVVDVANGADTVLVAGDDPATNVAAAETARRIHPDAALVVFTGDNPDRDQREAMRTVADRLVDQGTVVLDQIQGIVESDRGRRYHDLLETLRQVDGRFGVFTHDNPDPDAIASAVALRDLARSVGTEAEACYFGDISHQENRALVNLLDLDLVGMDADSFDPEEFTAYALVDHSRPAVNDQLPAELPVAVIIDHHPPRGAIRGDFVDLREDVGATSTLLAGYYRTLGGEIGSTVATALLYGIRVDTRDFRVGVTETDFEAIAYLVEHADTDILVQIESPSITPEMLTVLARSIADRTVRGPVLATSAGWTTNRDALAEAANTLLEMEGVTTVLVLGLFEEMDMAVVSARTRGVDIDIGGVLREAFDPIGSAGGHTDMAGAQIPLGILGDIEDQAGTLEEVISDVLIDRFFEVIAESGVFAPVESAD